MTFYRVAMRRILCIALIFLEIAVYVATNQIQNPYGVLGVSKSASSDQIKAAYKRLVKEWHPDKTSDPNASDRFVEIQAAYDILNDKERKARYDNFGTTTEDPPTATGFPFGFRSTNKPSHFSKHRITLRMYEDNILQRSKVQPFLLFAYSDWCLPCARAEPIWDQVVGDLQSIAYGIGTVNNMLDGTLVDRLRVSRLPSVVALVDGRTYHFRGMLSVNNVISFARSCLPTTVVHQIDNYNNNSLRRFIDGWRHTNKVSVVMLGSKDRPRTRLLLAAMRFHHFARFAYVSLHRINRAGELCAALGLTSTDGETLLIFNDRPDLGPVARLSSARELPADSMRDLIEKNKFLSLPRISSQAHFDELCPISASRQPRLCALLVAADGAADSAHLDAFRHFVNSDAARRLAKDNVRFAYVVASAQKDFVRAVRRVTEETQGDRNVLILNRVSAGEARLAWLDEVWNGTDEADANRSAVRLVDRIGDYLHGDDVLRSKADLDQLVDEHAPGWFSQLAHRTVNLWRSAVFHVSREEFLPAASVVGTLVLILLIGYGLERLGKANSRLGRRAADTAAAADGDGDGDGDSGAAPRRRVTKRESMKGPAYGGLMRELRAETYFGLIRLLKPGCRTVVILVDEPSKDILLPRFCQCIWPWRNNKTLTFAFLMVEKNLSWFRKVLYHALPTESSPLDAETVDSAMQRRLRNINPKQTVGTVLAINGWRQYFCMYHPMHAPSMAGYRPTRGAAAAAAAAAQRRNFLGFDDADDASDLSDDSDGGAAGATRDEVEFLKKKTIKTEDLLMGLENWLDRLFEGSVKRYYVPEWPEGMS